MWNTIHAIFSWLRVLHYKSNRTTTTACTSDSFHGLHSRLTLQNQAKKDVFHEQSERVTIVFVSNIHT